MYTLKKSSRRANGGQKTRYYDGKEMVRERTVWYKGNLEHTLGRIGQTPLLLLPVMSQIHYSNSSSNNRPRRNESATP